jgi:transcriptional regulator with XRE-family HTH domain
MNDIERLRDVLARYSLKRLARLTGIARMTLMRIRDGESSPTFAMADKIMAVVIADAIQASKVHSVSGRPPKSATTAPT